MFDAQNLLDYKENEHTSRVAGGTPYIKLACHIISCLVRNGLVELTAIGPGAEWQKSLAIAVVMMDNPGNVVVDSMRYMWSGTKWGKRRTIVTTVRAIGPVKSIAETIGGEEAPEK